LGGQTVRYRPPADGETAPGASGALWGPLGGFPRSVAEGSDRGSAAGMSRRSSKRSAMEGGRVTRPASACRFVVPPPRCHPSGAFRCLPLDRPGSPTRTRFTLQLVAVEPRRRSAPGSDWRLAGWARGAAPAPGASHRPSRRGRAGSARFRSRLVSPGCVNATPPLHPARESRPPGSGIDSLTFCGPSTCIIGHLSV
jgi:hypothetical protein